MIRAELNVRRFLGPACYLSIRPGLANVAAVSPLDLVNMVTLLLCVDPPNLFRCLKRLVVVFVGTILLPKVASVRAIALIKVVSLSAITAQ